MIKFGSSFGACKWQSGVAPYAIAANRAVGLAILCQHLCRHLFALARQAVCGLHTASRAGDPSKRDALALTQSQYRQRRGDYACPHLQIARRYLLPGISAHRDRRRTHRASLRQRLPPARRRVAGIGLAPRLPMAACPAQYRRRWIQLSLHGPAVPAPSGSVTPPRARA